MGGCLAIFLASFGAGRFYYGYLLAGFLKLALGLFAHCGTSIASKQAKSDGGGQKCGAICAPITLLAEIGFFVWWIWDMVVFFNGDLKPWDKPADCVFK